MGIIHKLANVKNYEKGDNYELGSSMSTNSIFGTGGSNINVLQEYSGYVWKCINARSETLSSQHIFIERLVNQKWQPDFRHDFNAVLSGEEDTIDLSELIEGHSVSMDMYGESFWYFSKGESSSKPMSVYLLDPAYVTVYVAGSRVTGYTYSKFGGLISLDVDEVAHFFIHDPRRPFRGVGPMQSAGWFIRENRYVTTYVNNFLENNAIPAGVIVAKGDVDDGDWKLFKSEWVAKYSGVNNGGKTGFVRGQDLDFVKTGLSLGDVDFEAVKNSSRDDILAMFGVPKPLLGIYQDINRASAVTARDMFALTFTQPALKRITRKLTRKVKTWYGEGFRVGSDNPFPDDREMTVTEVKAGIGRWLTVNEARAEYGKEPLPGGDVIDQTLAAPMNQNSLGKVTIKTKTAAATKSRELSAETKHGFRSETETIQLKYEKEFLSAINPVLVAQRDRVLAQLEPKKALDTQFDPQAETAAMVEASLPALLQLAEDQGKLATTFATNGGLEFKLTPVMVNYIRESIHASLLSFNTDTQELISQAVVNGLQEGKSLSEIGKDIKGIYDDATGLKTPGYRIERLTRTEVIKASNEITESAYKMTGVVFKKEWLANPGCCEFCSALDGSVIQLGMTYVQQGDTLEGTEGGTRLNDYEDVKHPPAHPSCRCTLIPVIEKDL